MRIRKTSFVVLACLLLVAGFAWGFAAHRNHVFPYATVKALGQSRWVRATARGIGLGDKLPGTGLDRLEVMPERVSREQRRRQTLRALPYVSGTTDPQPDREGVISRDPARTWQGLNLYGPVTEPTAHLVDMEGKVVYRWKAEGGPWQHRTLLPDGSLLVTIKDRALLKLDRRSRIVWRQSGLFHHDLWVREDGRIFALTENPEPVEQIHRTAETLVDYVTILSPEGEIVERVSILDAILDSPYAFLLTRIDSVDVDRHAGPVDPVHANHVEVFDGTLADRSTLFAEGNLLLSLRNPSLMVILEHGTWEVLWVWGPNNVLFQHHPTLLDNGHLLIFDNGIDQSRTIELDPLTGRIVWTYTAEDLFSKRRGSVQRLGNGNTLITESDTGYVFEITPEGDRVWTFAGPHFTEDGKRAAIWRMTRHDPEELDFPFRGRDAIRSSAPTPSERPEP